MVPPAKPRRSVFQLPAAFRPAQETKTPADVYDILRQHVAFTAAARAETRMLRRELFQLMKENTMKISELASTVDRLIATATSLKTSSDQRASEAERDDPAVEDLNRKIEDAIAVLEGRTGSSRGSLDSIGDPGAHAATPSADAMATDIHSAAARDPNAPV